MTFAVIGSSCPAVQVPSLSVYRGATTETTALVAPNVPAQVDWRMQANQIGAITDQIARYGAGLFGVPDGPTQITLTAPGSGLLLQVSAGHANIGGPVEIPAATTVAAPDNTARVWIWLRQSGALLPLTTTAPPSGENCLLGSCVTSGGNITSVDYSGVVYLRGGIGVRSTADAGLPSDTPPAAVCFLCETGGGTYLWDGLAWQEMGQNGAVWDTIADGQTVVVNDRQQMSVFDSLTVYGTFRDYGKARIT